MNDRRQMKNNVHRVGESLLVDWVCRARSIERAAVVSSVNLARALGAIRISAMEEQFPRAQPARIEIGKIAARPVMRGGVGDLMRNHHPADVSPSPGRTDRVSKYQPERLMENARPHLRSPQHLSPNRKFPRPRAPHACWTDC